MKKSTPVNKSLYNKVKNEAKKIFKKWPSAYASGWMVKEYKRRGGKYKGTSKSKSKGLGRWYSEEWINVCKLPNIVPCGRPKLYSNNWKKNYPYCRPRKRINSQTPKIARELTSSEIKRRCSIKRKNPTKRVFENSKKIKNSKKISKRKSRSSKKISKRKSRSSKKISKRKSRSSIKKYS